MGIGALHAENLEFQPLLYKRLLIANQRLFHAQHYITIGYLIAGLMARYQALPSLNINNQYLKIPVSGLETVLD